MRSPRRPDLNLPNARRLKHQPAAHEPQPAHANRVRNTPISRLPTVMSRSSPIVASTRRSARQAGNASAAKWKRSSGPAISKVARLMASRPFRANSRRTFPRTAPIATNCRTSRLCYEPSSFGTVRSANLETRCGAGSSVGQCQYRVARFNFSSSTASAISCSPEGGALTESISRRHLQGLTASRCLSPRCCPSRLTAGAGAMRRHHILTATEGGMAVRGPFQAAPPPWEKLVSGAK